MNWFAFGLAFRHKNADIHPVATVLYEVYLDYLLTA